MNSKLFCFKDAKETLSAAKVIVEEIEKESSSIIKKSKKDQTDQIKRLLEKLKEEWTTANKAFKERNDRFLQY